MIQEAHKKADNNFNDFVAQLYEQEFKTQQKAKEEHIRQAKEKALEEQRKVEEEKARIAKQEAERIEQEREEAARANDKKQGELQERQAVISSSAGIGADWSTVSQESAANYMSARTGVSASKWLDVIYKESSGNPYAENSLTCWGYLQIMQSVHGNVSSLSPQEYLDKAVGIYQSSGGTAWETW